MSPDPQRQRRGPWILAGAGPLLILLLSTTPARTLAVPLPTLSPLPLASALASPAPLPTLGALPTIGPLPTLPLPTPPLPTLSPPTISPVPPISPLPTLPPQPTASSSARARSDQPSPAASPAVGLLPGSSVPLSADATPDASPSPASGFGPAGEPPGSTGGVGRTTLGDILVPGLIVGVPSLLVIGIIVVQLLGATFWLPVVRRVLGPLGARRSARPPD